MKRKIVFIGVSFMLTHACCAWNSISEFNEAATNALKRSTVLISDSFVERLTHFMSTTKNHEAQVVANLVYVEKCLAEWNEEMRENSLDVALSTVSNICVQTQSETNMWYSWHARLLLAVCHSERNETSASYAVVSNALDQIGQQDFMPSNIVSRAILERNQTAALSIRQSLILSKALDAALLHRNGEAITLAADLPARYQKMIRRIIANGE